MNIEQLIATTTTVDFETEAIGPRPHAYPPRPVGVAIRWSNKRTEYLAWGHPSGNNATWEQARDALHLAWTGPVLFHNGKFDLEVAWRWFHMKFPRRWDDTLFMLFLFEAHAQSFSLKPSAQRLLNEPPEEQDALHAWVVANVPGATKKNAGAHISKAPVDLVGPYAIGDVKRTHAIFAKLAPEILGEQEEAYNREKRLMPHLVVAEQRGVRVFRDLLVSWDLKLDAQIVSADSCIYNELGKVFNVDSGDELADALQAAGRVTEWELTETGKRSTAKDSLLRCVNGSRNLVDLLRYRNTASTMLGTFVRPWLTQSAPDGRLHTTWHQVRGLEANGTRTGRPSSSDPNLANVPNPAEIAIPAGFPPLPMLRRALLPEEGEEWVCADYNGQELRIAAHYEDGEMLRAYKQNPGIDFHSHAAMMVTTILGKPYATPEEKKKWRRICKTVGFLLLYGGGVRKLSEQLGCSMEEAEQIRAAYFAAVPGLKAVIDLVAEKSRTNGSVRSLGGRILKPEPPAYVTDKRTREKVLRDFLYKMFNKLIQGSAADQTKEAIIQFCESGTDGKLLATVYDEIDISAPPGSNAADELARCMTNAIPCDTPMLVDVEHGDSWGNLRERVDAVRHS